MSNSELLKQLQDCQTFASYRSYGNPQFQQAALSIADHFGFDKADTSLLESIYCLSTLCVLNKPVSVVSNTNVKNETQYMFVAGPRAKCVVSANQRSAVAQVQMLRTFLAPVLLNF